MIPVRRDRILSDGRVHPTTAWSWLERKLGDFGGATRATGLYEGWYLDPDTREPIKDLSRRYIVALPRKHLGRLRTLLREACDVFQQKCIYLSIAGYVEFIERPSDETS